LLASGAKIDVLQDPLRILLSLTWLQKALGTTVLMFKGNNICGCP
jgi:hypothetical protein